MIKILIVLEGERTESDFFESILGNVNYQYVTVYYS